jgi:hypothetical protein
MNSQAIPPQTLNEVYKTIAQRHEIDPAKLTKDQIDEDEFMAALAYNRGSPLIEPQDLSEELVGMCRQSSRELDPKGMAEYKFVPLTIRGQTLLVISSCPWDPMMVEVISGYFPQCSQIRFALTSPQTLGQLLNQLQGEAASPMVGYTSARPVAPLRPLIQTAAPAPAKAPVPPPPPTGPAPASALPQIPAITIQPSGAPPTPKYVQPPKPVEAVKSPLAIDSGLLSQEDISYLANLLIQEANTLLARKRITKP